MMDSNDKWVWGDEQDSTPQALPLLDQKLTPIIEWPALQPEPDPPISTDSAECPEQPGPGSPGSSFY